MSAELHDRVERALQSVGCDIGAAECHGILCGMLCGPSEFDAGRWLAQVSGQDDLSPFQREDAYAALEELVRRTGEALGASDFSFWLLLPDDDAALAHRVAAFSGWCRGYLAGLGLGGVVDLGVLGEDARSFIGDLERFCRIDSEEVGAGDERALEELIEFTRMGALIVRAEAGGSSEDGSEPPPAVH